MKRFVWLLLLVSLTSSAEEFRRRVVVIDTGIDSLARNGLCKDGHKDFTGTGLADNLDHGTEVVRILLEKMNVGKYCITIVKWANNREENYSGKYLADVSEYVSSLFPVFVNMSMNGNTYVLDEETYIQNMVSSGTRFFVSAGNNSQDLTLRCNVYPACYNITNAFNVVGAEDQYGYRLTSSNYAGPVNEMELGVHFYGGKVYSGTSFAAPAGLAKELR